VTQSFSFRVVFLTSCLCCSRNRTVLQVALS